MNHRFKLLQEKIRAQSLDALLVTKDINIEYLTGFPASESWLLVTLDQSYYLTDFRYVEEAKLGLPKHVQLREYKKSFYHTLEEIVSFDEIKRIGLDPQEMTLAQWRSIESKISSDLEWLDCFNWVEGLRMIKEPGEVEKVRKALEIHQEALLFLKNEIQPGKTESDVFKQLEQFVRDKGVTFSFDPIIASGPNSAFPHASVTDRKLEENEPVLVDFGIKFEGYKSDLTRMFFLGKMSQLVAQVHEHVGIAQQKAIEKIVPGATFADVDKAARGYLEDQNLAQYFGHSLGHGVGLEIHEPPRLSQKSVGTVQPGMIITVEPGVYLPDQFGIRLEEMILVTDKGCEVISGYIN